MPLLNVQLLPLPVPPPVTAQINVLVPAAVVDGVKVLEDPTDVHPAVVNAAAEVKPGLALLPALENH